MVIMNEDSELARQQQIKAVSGGAMSQCGCGSYRLDGQPPILHQPGCPSRATALGASANGLKRLRISLVINGNTHHLLLVGDRFEEGGRYVHTLIPRYESASWSPTDWEEQYQILTQWWLGETRNETVT